MKTFVQRRLDLFLGLALFALALTVYLCTLCPTIYWGDSGELAAAAYSLGIVHPTGYPVWTLVTKAWTLLFPFGTIIWRMNVLSAVFGSLAVVALFGLGRRLELPRPIAFCTAGLFAFTQTFWQQCLFAETYSLTACYTCTILYLTVRWRNGGRTDRDLRLLALVCGLAMTNGQINTLFLPGVIACILWTRPDLLGLRQAAVRAVWLKTLGIGVLPLLSYLYLPLRAAMHPAINWGDPETPYAFFYHVTGQPYAGQMFHLPPVFVWMDFRHWAQGLGDQYPWAVFALSALGLWAAWSRRETRPVAFLLTWVLIADVGYAINYAIYNQYIYYIPSHIVLTVFAGLGVQYVWPRLEGFFEAPKRPALRGLGTAGVVLLLALQIGGHWRKNDLHNNWTCEDYGRNILASAPTGAILIDNAGDDSHSACTYLRTVEGLRPDVVYVHRSLVWSLYDRRVHRWANIWIWKQLVQSYPPAASLYPGGRPTSRQSVSEDVLRRLLAQAVGAGRPVAVIRAPKLPLFIDENGQEMQLSEYLNAHYATASVGVLTRVYPRGERPSDAVLLAQTRQVWSRYSLRGIYDGMYLEDGFLTPIAIDYADAGLARAHLDEKQGDYADAAAAYGGVLKLFRSDEAAAGLARCAQRLAAPPPVTQTVTGVTQNPA